MKIYIKVITKSQRYNEIPMYTGSVPGKTIKISKKYNKDFVPKIWGRQWILNKLVRVSNMYSFPPFYSIYNHINMIFGLPLPFSLNDKPLNALIATSNYIRKARKTILALEENVPPSRFGFTLP